jgi:hypothetical protein
VVLLYPKTITQSCPLRILCIKPQKGGFIMRNIIPLLILCCLSKGNPLNGLLGLGGNSLCNNNFNSCGCGRSNINSCCDNGCDRNSRRGFGRSNINSCCDDDCDRNSCRGFGNNTNSCDDGFRGNCCFNDRSFRNSCHTRPHNNRWWW